MSVEAAFSKYAMVYDQTRRQFIPCFDDFYNMAVGLIPKKDTPLKILDLGAGTGLLSAMVIQKYPDAQITLADISEDMLDQARVRFKETPADIEFIVADYRKDFPKGMFDVVISALSIHHLDHEEKKTLFSKSFDHISPGGIFINADQALGQTDEIDSFYRQWWFRLIREAGVTAQEMAGAKERMKEDKMSTLNDQLTWMETAGFLRVNCWYKYLNFVVYSGSKPGFE